MWLKGDFFGSTVSISGNHAIIGAPGGQDAGSASGCAYIFEHDISSGSWSQMEKITASDAEKFDFDRFGTSVFISGDHAIVGAPDNDDSGRSSGSAYIFERDISSGSWSQVEKITALDAAPFDFFGISVSISGDHAIVGAIQTSDGMSDAGPGAAYIFERDIGSGRWFTSGKDYCLGCGA